MPGLSELLARGDAVLDGGFATELEVRGHDLRDPLWSARVLRDEPAVVEDVHAAYFEAGADVATTASYQATFERLGEDAGPLLRRSVELARRARDRTGGRGLVVGSVGPYCVVWANGAEYTGDYAAAGDEQIAVTQRRRLAELVAAGADAIAFETIPNVREAAILAELLEELPGVEAWLSFCCRDGVHLSDGTAIDDAIRAAGRNGRVTAFGVNCTPPEHVGALLERARSVTDRPLLVYPNHGRAWDEAGYTWSGIGVDRFPARLVARWRALGASAVGGCCGIGPQAIADLAGRL
ncbi:MAG TPA: homocysteine S-methyltransferase [Gaiellaceae bacterium]|nr:homocysteine S-methyltransferase [Gaiellaceae bacterium]